ncbi:MAG TPA: type I 3-dehydroquinate dehydratase [Candidatus Angelobacter sp.]
MQKDNIQLVANFSSRAPTDAEVRTLSDKADWLEIRSDLWGEIAPEWIREAFSGRLLYSLRSRQSGGAFSGSTLDRQAKLVAASSTHHLVELEAIHDFSPALLSAIPEEKRIISWYGPAADVRDLLEKFEWISQHPAHIYKLVVTGASTTGLVTLSLLRSLRRSDVVAFCEGPLGLWSRLVAPKFGAPLIYAAGAKSSSTAEPDVHQLISDYGFPKVHPLHRLYGIVGSPVFQSSSPRLHNAAYRKLGVSALFVPFQAECFERFWQEIVESQQLDHLGIPLHGLTIVSPYKEDALGAATTTSPMVQQTGSTNIFVRTGSAWAADTTDPESVLTTTRERGISVQPKKAAVIGCGGAGRAVAAALQQAGADVTLVNRGKERADKAVKLLGLPFIPLSQFNARGFSLLVNATPIGRDDTKLPFEIQMLNDDAVVVDLAYGLKPTLLVTDAVAQGHKVIDGHDVLISQVRRQFKMMVGREMPDMQASEQPESLISRTIHANSLECAAAAGD